MAWAHVNFAQASSFSPGSVLNQTIAAVASGNIVTIAIETAGGTVSSVTDNEGNTYNPVGTGTSAGNNFIAYMSNGPITNAPTQLTVNGTWSAIITAYDEWSPPSGTTSTALDGNAYDSGFTGSPTDVTGTSFATSHGGDLVVSYAVSNASVNGAGWTATSGLTGSVVSEYQTQGSAGSIAGAWNLSGSYFIGTFGIFAGGLSAQPPTQMRLIMM